MSWSTISNLTKVNLSDVDGYRAEVAVRIADELQLSEARAQVEGALREVLRRGLTMPPVEKAAVFFTQVAAAAAALGALENALAADVAATAAVNRERLIRRRDEFIRATFDPTRWGTLVKVKGPKDPDFTRPLLNKGRTESEVTADWLGQYDPPTVVFAAARGGGRRDVLWPIYPTDTTGLGASLPDARYRFWYFGRERMVLEDLPELEAVAGGSTGRCVDEVACKPSDLPSKLRWLKFGCLPIAMTQGCAPWSRCFAFYSLGTWPCWGGLGQRWPIGPQGLTIATLLQSPSAVHLAMPATRVKQALLDTVLRCGVDKLPKDPGQGAYGVFRRGVRLVLRGAAADEWGPAAGLQLGKATPPLVRGVDLAVQIDRLCDWLALRHALLLALQERLPLPPDLRAAAASSADPDLRAAAAGTWRGAPFHVDDPLGLFHEAPPKRRGRTPEEASEPGRERPDRGPPAFWADPEASTSSTSLGWFGAGAVALAAGAFAYRRRRT